MSTLSHSSTASQAAEALLNRARRLSSNAYERSCPPTTFSEGEEQQQQSTHLDAFRPRSHNMPIFIHRSSTRPNSLSNPLSTTTASTITTSTTTTTIQTTITSTPLIVSDAEDISLSSTDQTPSKAPTTPEEANHTSSISNNNNNTFLDPSRAHTLPCTTSTSSQSLTLTRHSSLSSARPRALTLEAIREARDPEGENTTDNNNKSPKDQHRKHRSENGGSLVRDILAALRHNTELESPTFNRHADLTSLSPKQRQQHSIQTADTDANDGGELDGDSLAARRKSALLPNQIAHPQKKDEMNGKSNSELDLLATCPQHVPESEGAKSQTTVGEPSLTSEATLPPGLEGLGHGGGGDGTSSSAADDETKEIETNTITPDNASSLSSDDSSEVSQDGLLAAPAHQEHDDDSDNNSEKEVASESNAAESSKRTSTYFFPSLSTGSTKQHQQLERESSRKEGKEGKGAFLLHRIGVRKNSFTESAPPSSATLSPMDGGSGASETSSIRSQSTQRAAGSGFAQHGHQKLTKRSTKILGKFVPKFLQTSFSPSLSTPSNTSPRLQTVGVSPLSSRSSRSGSISGQSGQSNHSPVSKTEGMFSADTAGSSAPSSNKSSRESLTLNLTNHQYDPDSLSPGYTHMDATSPQYLEFLRSDTRISPSLMARRSSCSSATSKMSGNSLGSKPSSSVTSFDPSESNDFRRHSGSAKGGDSMFAFEVEEEDMEENQEGEDFTFAAAAENDEAAADADEDDPMSPYIIDEDCDDDFFLNSVLRKKSNPSMTTDYNDHRQGNHHPVMMSSYPSGTTMSSIHSSATTPSLTGWSSSSSQASTPSPTSPLLLNGQVYPFPITAASPPNSATNASSFGGMNSPSSGNLHLHYRSNPLPPPIKLGLDEKRSRLREAVGEWRRSANMSN
ncbi:MAG: hypothetical protein J3R72DRAFT_432291 [Linnemannia gamsii]|nr:MAG: hypothetical protein J3R72DRAFT_432291 [Linnemannia gamsii]